ncbi:MULTISPECIES: M20/M25/M40 family metallo-hydrolase [unclassified Brachybacterium]|uniref:M20/M25/M40 family metallo-hydrolase n=1 Tax=unclassified Brachybacterium TaxID=2623841 RepID=UPI003F92580A
MLDPIALSSDLIHLPSVSTDADGMRAVQGTVSDALLSEVPDALIRSGGMDRPWTLLSVPGKVPAPLFACHTDTVPVGDIRQWARDPFGGEIEGGILHGRGAVDMKGGLAAATAALARAAARGAGGHLLLTADEEIGSLGAQRTGEALADLDLAGIIIPEATNLRVCCSHRGASWLRLTSRGRAAHGSTPGRGVNAVLRLSQALRKALPTAPVRRHPVLGAETVSIGTFHGGEATNIVPAEAVATIDQRTIGEASSLSRHWRDADGIDEVETILDLAPLSTDPGADFVRTLPSATDPDPVPYFTDGSVLSVLRPDVPIVVWGPGDPGQMHAVDEQLDLTQLTAASELFERVLRSVS